ncbi:MAG: hypothetical protein R2702_06660 [Acidimicrobiales bacterium]
MERFEVFCTEAFDVSSLEAVDWRSSGRSWALVTPMGNRLARQRFSEARRSAIRLLFQSARRLGLTTTNPPSISLCRR